MTTASNPRAVSGGNLGNNAPDFARQEVERLEQDYALVAKTAEDLIAEAEPLPEEIPDDDGKGIVVDLIKRMRDTSARAEALRVTEKEPHYRRGQGVDQFFFGIIDKLARRDRKNKPGVADTLQARLTRYDTRKLEEERARLRRIAEEDDPAAHPLGKEIVALIERWKLGAGHAKSKTSADRVKAVKARLKDGYSIEQLELAVDGICAYPFVTNGGRARSGQPSNRHDRLGICLGGGEKVEEFARLGHAARKAGWTPEEGWPT